MNKAILKIDQLVKKSLKNDKTGHGYDHTIRVLKNSMKLAKHYPKANKEILWVAALLHDIGYKDGPVKNHHLVGAKQAEKILSDIGFPKEKISKVVIAIEDHVAHMSTPLRKNSELQIESKILRDADNIDALGIIGVKRMSAFSKNQKVPNFISKEDKLDQSLYGNLNFLLDWPERMLTPEGRKIGKQSLKPIRNFMKKLEKERR